MSRHDPSRPPPSAPSTTLARSIAIKQTYQPNHLNLALAEMAMALPDYEKAEQYYDGTKNEEFSSQHIARALRNTRNKYKVNFAKTPVNVIADRLVVSSVTVKEAEAEDDTDTDNDTDQTKDAPAAKNDLTKLFEKEIWKKAKLARLIKEVIKKASEYGDAYLFVWPRSELNSETGEYEDQNSPVYYYNSPKTTRMIYDPEAPDTPLFVVKKWKDVDGRYRCNLYYKTTIEHLVMKKDTRPDTDLANHSDGWEQEQEPSENPFNRLPVFHFRNSDPYGVPEHKDGYGPQDAINKISTTMVHTTEYQGFPQRYGLSKPNGEISGGGPGEDWDDETESTEPEDQTTSEMRTGPGTMIKLENMDSVGTFDVADSKGFLEPMEFYIRSLAQTTVTPLRYFYPPGAHPPSGESYRAEDTPLINKAKDRQTSYTNPMQDSFAFGMEIVTERDAEEFMVDVKWAPAASIDDALGWETVIKKIEAGVPRRQALIEAGYTADQVDEWLKDNSDKAEFQRDVEIFSLLAAAAKNFSDTGAANGMNPKAVGTLLTHFAQRLLPKGAPKLPLPEEKKEDPKPNPNRLDDSFAKPPRFDLPPGGVRQHDPTNSLPRPAQ